MATDAEGMPILEGSARMIKQNPPYGFVPATQRDYRGYLDFYRNSVFKGAQ
jgi:hypothetical protein